MEKLPLNESFALPSQIECCREQPGNSDEHNFAAPLSSQDTFGTSSCSGDIYTFSHALAIFILQVVTVAYYNIRLVLTLTISLLTAKTVLMTLFIMRFDTMSGN